MLTDKSTFFSSISLSDKESMVLRSYALGMGDTAICKTLKLSRIQLNQIAQSLLDKFCVQNQYHLVKKAYRVGYLDQSNFILGEVINHLHINDFFLLGLEKGVDVKTFPKETLFKHLYRVQKLSSRYYEFRSAHKQISNQFDYPDYIRINNFG